MTQGSVSQLKAKVKVVLLGDQSTGKTSIINRFIRDLFEQDTGPTIGIDFLARNITLGNWVVRLQLWDTAGQQRFRSLIPNYLKDALVVILVFDIASTEFENNADRKTLENIPQWLDLYNQNRHEKATLMLVGNKCDLEVREVSREEAQQKAKQIGAPYYEVSAKTAVGIEKLFIDAGRSVIKVEEMTGSMASSQIRSQLKKVPEPPKPDNAVHLTPVLNSTSPAQKKKKKCCG